MANPNPARIPPQTPPAGGKSAEVGRIHIPSQLFRPAESILILLEKSSCKVYNYSTRKEIEDKLKIPRSTLSGWLKMVKLQKNQKDLIYKRWKQRLVATRKRAIEWHNTQKINRINEAENQALKSLETIDVSDPSIQNLALSMLYLGEGFKKDTFGMGNSDPMILKLFVSLLLKIYLVPLDKLSCELHLRADQDTKKIKKYWSRELGIPIGNFKWVSIDQRTIGSPTYPHYKGVCIIRLGSIAIQRKLLYTSKIFCQRVAEKMRA